MTLNLLDILMISAIVWLPVLIVFIFYSRMREKRRIHEANWIESEGSRPAIFNVDVIYKNGKMRKNVSAKELNWDKFISNPILKYCVSQKI
jgi:hypothetical protein